MAGVIPRGLPRRASGFDQEKEEFEKAQATAVAKAINAVEVPVKEKHLRIAILGTHREKGCTNFWLNVHRLQLDGNPIVSWKFCHAFHKILREGHKHVLADSLRYRSKVEDLGKMWVHLKEGYGRLIAQYCKLLCLKLDFHHRNPRIPGNLQLTDDELESIGEKDVNCWFELSVEMLDYLDEIIALQKHVFNSLDMSRASSMTSSGQCRLAPMILCILDSSCLYDYLVKMLFKLHAALPADILSGHRDRFNTIFKPLKRFYYSSSNLQYFKNLISIPPLPENPPNFLQASAFDDYVTPQVRMMHGGTEASDTPPDSRSLNEQILVEIDNNLPAPSHVEPAKSPAFHMDELVEKDQIINSLRHDLDDSKATMQKLQHQFGMANDQMQRRLLELETELSSSKDLIYQISEENERYREQAEVLQNERNQEKATKLEETEKKAQTSEDKFKKMKDVYAKLREEHIETLKKVGSVEKEAQLAKKQLEDFRQIREREEMELRELRVMQSLSQDQVQQSTEERTNLARELEKYRQEIDQIRTNFESQLHSCQIEKLALDEEVKSHKSELKKTSESLVVAESLVWELFRRLCMEVVVSVKDTVEQFENPAHLGVTCSPEFLLSRTQPSIETLHKMKSAFQTAKLGESVTAELVAGVSSFATSLCEVLIHGKATSNIAPVDQTSTLINHCQVTADCCTQLFSLLSQKGSWIQVEAAMDVAIGRLSEFESSFRSLLGKIGDVKAEDVGNLMEKEMKAMDQAIVDAAAKILEILSKTREKDTGVKLEVSEKILASCTSLMQAVKILVEKSRDLQKEIVAQGRGTGSVLEFYKRHHQWTEGLLSAAKAVGLGATVLCEAADRVIDGKGKWEELMVASQEIAASTAQLVVSSRVKANRESERLTSLMQASRGVTSATATVVGNVKAGVETLTEKESLDFSKLSLHQAKKLEMESQVKLLELESSTQKERAKLSELRRRHYQMAGVAEGWDAT